MHVLVLVQKNRPQYRYRHGYGQERSSRFAAGAFAAQDQNQRVAAVVQHPDWRYESRGSEDADAALF